MPTARYPVDRGRHTLERRYRDLNTASRSEATTTTPELPQAHRQNLHGRPNGANTGAHRGHRAAIYQGDSSETAQAAVNALQASSSERFTPRQPLPMPSTSAVAVSSAAPFQDIPAQYIKDIQAGKFFDLSKLLPKNLSIYDDEDNLVLTLENSVVKVSRKTKPSASTSITDIEQWTTAFTCYMSVLTHKFPTRSQELLQYLSLIRYAARVHKGLGWAIYDFKFRQKAGVNKSLNWSIIDTQLWLTIFTVSPGVLQDEYPLFFFVPQRSVSKTGAANRGTCNLFNRNGTCSRDPCHFRHVCNRCNGAHPGCDCPTSSRSQQEREQGRDRNSDRSNSHSSSSQLSSSRRK